MWTSGFFNSVNGDRTYNADQMSSIFEGLITDGVYASVGNKMAVQPNNGMTIQIASGRGWFGKHWVDNDTEYTLALEGSDVTLNRYAAVCVKVDTTNSVRSVTPFIKYSSFATVPVKPTMTRTESIKEYCLAYVYIKAGATVITVADIIDTRANTDLCGWVTGLIEQLNSTTLWTQWETLFNEWFDNLQDKINSNTETMLVAALPTSLTVSIGSGDWEADPDNSSGYVAYKEVTGMTSTKTVICEIESEYAGVDVRLGGQDTNVLTFKSDTPPTYTIKVKIVHMGV